MGTLAGMNALTPQLISQIFAQESNDPFLILLTFSHESFGSRYLVNNTENIVSRGITFESFPFTLRLPVDDGETARSFTIELDNVSLYLLEEIRSVTTEIEVKIEMILASWPDEVQLSQEELKIQELSYNKSRITATIVMDGFLNTEVSSEKYGPQNFPGIF